MVLVLAMQVPCLRAETIYWPLTAQDRMKQVSANLDCTRNLRQIVRAARVWSLENGRQYPSEIRRFTNHLESPARLICPANVAHSAPENWDGLDWGQTDYEWVPEARWDDADGIACRCRVHDNAVRVNGSVVGTSLRFRSGWPAIVAAPLYQVATPGSEIRFEVRIAPDALVPVRYQWQRQRLHFVTNVTFVSDPEDANGGHWRTNRHGAFTTNLLPDQTNASYVIPDAQTHHADHYSVVVSNALGAAASPPSRLYVDPSVGPMTTDNRWSAVHCVNNLKQITLFGRLLASDHDGLLPQSLSSMTNSYGQPVFGWPVVLHCRLDRERAAPWDWAGVDLENTSYEVLPVPRPVEEDFQAPFCRCRIHGFYAQADGQVVWQPRFNGIRPLPGNVTELDYTVLAGQTHRLEASSNLVDWAPLGPGSSRHETIRFRETPTDSRRFYRIRTE